MHFSQAQYFASVAWWIIRHKLKKKGGGFIITFSEVLSYICNLYNSMNIICAMQLSQNIIYGFLLGVWKSTSEADGRVPPAKMFTYIIFWLNIKDANVSEWFKASDETSKRCATARRAAESGRFWKAASIVIAGSAFSSLKCRTESSFFFICYETNWFG